VVHRYKNNLTAQVGQGESEVHARYGGVSYKPHSQAPYIHRITCLEDEKVCTRMYTRICAVPGPRPTHPILRPWQDWFCLDGELLNAPPALAGPRSPLAAPAHVLVLESPRVRIYKARVHSKPRDGDAPGAATYPFHGVLVALAPGVLAPPYGACAPGDVWEIEPGAPLPRAALADPGTDGDRDEDAALDAYVVELRA
jgi:hypothetical protein